MMDVSKLKAHLGLLAKNVYFCGASSHDAPLSIYVKDKATSRTLTDLFREKKKANPAFDTFKVFTTSTLGLGKTRSLEEILLRVPHQVIVFDPTATIERAKILVDIAKQSRQLLGSVLTGCYFNSERRNIHFLVKAKKTKEPLDLNAIRTQVEPILITNTQRLSQPFNFSITISLQKPKGTVIAVDKGSVTRRKVTALVKTLANKLKWPLLVAGATSGLGIAGAASAANGSLPAVGNINGWVGGAADYLHNERSSGAGGIVEAGIDLPLTHDFAAQLHGYTGAAGGRNLQSIDGILFWRNPASGLLGPHVMYTKSGSFHHTLYGLHGEYYLYNWTLTGEAGGVSRNELGCNPDNSGTWYGEAIVNWYAVPDWRIYLGGIAIDNHVGGELGTEYQLGLSSLPGLSIFADVGAGSHDLHYAFLGLHYYFGDPIEPVKALIRRHREDMDPPTLDLLVMNRDCQATAPRVTS